MAAATRTPFESSRRVFVIEAADAMNDQAANRMLKTLEEPPAFVHLLLLTDRREDVLETIASRCQHVRFDPLPPARIAERLEGLEPQRAQACARLALGDASLAARLAGEEGASCGRVPRIFVRSALAGYDGRAPVDRAAGGGEGRGNGRGRAQAQERMAGELELLPSRERKRYEREGLEARRRGERRARTHTLDLALRLAELWLRDVLCICEGAPELVHAVDRRSELEEDARASDARGRAVRGDRAGGGNAAEPALNVSEELALEALAYRLESLLHR